MIITLTPNFRMYYSQDSLYGVYSFTTEFEIEHNDGTINNYDGTKLYKGVLVGNMQELTLGVEYKAKLKEVHSKKYNKMQYEPVRIEPIVPKSIEHQTKFLKTVVTEKQAEALLSIYPNIVQMIIDDKHVDLSKTKGIKHNSFSKIKQKVLSTYADSYLYVMLKPIGVTSGMIDKLKEKHPNPHVLKQKLRENPYELTEIRGLGFKKIDDLALKLNQDLRISMFRLKAYIEFKLSEIGDGEGHTRLSFDELETYIKSELGLCHDLYLELIEQEKKQPRVLHIDSKNKQVGLKRYFNTEALLLDLLQYIQNAESCIDTNLIDFDKAFCDFESSNGYCLTDEQKRAVLSLKDNNIAIIVGNAGTGKSSVIDAIIKSFSQSISITDVTQCALSAKASRRMTEVTGIDSKTIHSAIYTKDKNGEQKATTLESKLIIVDEFSMVNAHIVCDLLKSIKKGSKLVLCFDDAQLPPIGYGNVATDLLNSKFNINRLTKVHRQAQASGILSDANIVRLGKNPIKEFKNNLITGELRDMYYSFKNDKKDIFDTVVKYYLKSVETLSVDDVCIVVPRKDQSIISTESFNNAIQEELLGHVFEEVKSYKTVFKLGTKVIQRANDPVLNVVNGEIGKLIYINNNEDKYKIDFGNNKVVEYNGESFKNVELAYALSCHASQGSQYHTVIVALSMDGYILLSKELLYTAITRAKNRCMVVSEPKAFDISCKKQAGKRKTWLQLLINS